jgi:hypothetical protein
MQTRTTLFLLVLAILVAGGFYIAKKRVPSSDELADQRKRVVDIKASEVVGIGVKGADRDFLFEKEKGKWNFKKPLQVRANGNELEGVLSSMEYMERRRTLTPSEIAEAKLSLKDYGLEKPRISVSFRTRSKTVTLNVGSETRQGDGVYVQVAGDRNVSLVGKDFATRVDKKLEDYRERSLFDFIVADVQQCQIKNGPKLLEICSTNAQWRIIQPLSARADTGKVDNFLQKTSGLKAEDFLSENPTDSKEYGLEEPSQEVSVRLNKQDAIYTLLIGSKLKNDDKKVAAKVKGQNSIVSINASYGDEAAKPLNEFRDHRLCPFTSTDVAEIELRNRQVATVIQKDGDAWKIAAPDKVAAESELVQKFFSKLDSLQIKDFTTDVVTDLDKFGLKPAPFTVVLKGKAAGEPGSTNAAPASVLLDLEIGKTDSVKKLTYAKLANESSVYAVDAAELADLPKGVLDLRTLVLFSITKDTIKSCSQKKGKGTVTIDATADKKWKLGENTQGILDDTPWLKFVNSLSLFRVDKIVGTALNSMTRPYGFENPVATVTVQYEKDGKPATTELLIGKTPEKKYYVLWKDQLLVVEISPDLYQTLVADWIVKPAPPAPATTTAAPAAPSGSKNPAR